MSARQDLLRLVTAGGVEDGKSTLVDRLLDGSGARAAHAGGKARQDGAADVVYRYFQTAKRRFIIADAPGTDERTRDMAVGASTADLAVILVDARRGVLPQSKRHGFIASLLGVPRAVVAVNKMDLVDFGEEAFERIREEYETFAQRLGFGELTFIPVSATHGDNVVNPSARMPWHHGLPLLGHLESVYIGGDANLIDFRFPVQRVARPEGGFRGYSGSVASGVVRAGDEVVVLPSGQRTTVERIATFDGDIPYAYPPQSVTLTFADDIDAGRGDLIAHPANVPTVARTVEAMVVWMSDVPLEAGAIFLLKQTTRTVRASCSAIAYRVDPQTLHHRAGTALAFNDIGRVRFTLFEPLFVDEYLRNRATGSFLVIDPAGGATLAAGTIIERHSARDTLDPLHGIEAQAPASRDIAWEGGAVTPEQRSKLFGNTPVTLWLTGLSGSGKSTLAKALERRLIELGRPCYRLDGDNLRHALTRDLGFTPEDRRENIRRVAEVARLMNDAGLIVITAFISPYREDREMARRIIGPESFVEVYLSADLSTCEKRDPKGLYVKARRGEISGFTGIDAPYETPQAPGLVLDTGAAAVAECLERLLEEASRHFAGRR